MLSLSDAQGQQVSFGRVHTEPVSLGGLLGNIYGFESSIKEFQHKTCHVCLCGCDSFLKKNTFGHFPEL